MERLIDIIKELKPSIKINSFCLNEIENIIDEYNELLSENNTKVLELLNSVVLKKSVTAKEKEDLISILEVLNEKELDKKIKVLCKSISENENIGLELIKEIDNDELTKRIHKKAKTELNNALSSYWGYAGINSDVIFVSLTLIALKKYDSGFYEYVRDEYSDIYNNYSAQKIEGTIREIIRKYKREDVDDSKRLITSLLMNAIVPEHFLVDYFDFIFDIYKLNFDYQIDNSDDEFNFIFNGLYTALRNSEETDELNLSVTKKTYHLIQSTKKFIISEKERNFINAIRFSKEVLKIIDKNYWNQDYINDSGSYFTNGYKNWVKSHEKEIAEGKRTRAASNTFVSRWEPFIYLDMNTKKVIMLPPDHKFKDDVDNTKIIIRVFNGNDIIYEKERPSIKKFVIGGYVAESERIVINNPIGKLRYVVYEGTNIIYDSKQIFCRDVFVFNPKDGLEIKNNTEYKGDAIFCYRTSNSNVKDFYNDGTYKLGIKNVDVGDVLYFGKDPFAFSKTNKPGICGDIIKNLFVLLQEEKLKVYKDFDYLMFETNIDEKDIVIKINNIKHKLTSLEYRKIRKELWSQYIVMLPISRSGLYRISASNIRTNELIKNTNFSFVLDSDYSCVNTKINSTNYRVVINSSLFDEEKNFDIYLKEFDGLEFPILLEGRESMYQIPLKVDLYRIDDGEWNILDNPMWIDDIKAESTMDIYGDGIKYIQPLGFSDQKAMPLEPVECNARNNITSLRIGHLLSYRNSYSQVVLQWKNEDDDNKGIWVDNECKVNKRKTIIQYDPYNKELVIKVKYYGKGLINVAINNVVTDKNFSIKNIESDKEYRVNDLQENCLYNISVLYCKTGLLISKDKPIYEESIVPISYDNLINTRFKIQSIEYNKKIIVNDENGRGHYKLEIANSNLISTYLLIEERISANTYKASLYHKQGTSGIMFNNINPVALEVIGEIRNGCFEATLEKNSSPLQYDGRHRTIYDELNRERASEINSYLLKAEAYDG